jgi:hypothetical protein
VMPVRVTLQRLNMRGGTLVLLPNTVNKVFALSGTFFFGYFINLKLWKEKELRIEGVKLRMKHNREEIKDLRLLKDNDVVLVTTKEEEDSQFGVSTSN